LRVICTATRFHSPSETKIPPLLNLDSKISVRTDNWGSIMISGFVKASVFIAIAFVVAALLVSNSVPFYAGIAVSFANISASLVDKFGLEAAGTNQSTLAQPTAAVEPVTLTDNQPPAPNRNAASAPTEPVVENVESQPDVLFRQFQAWAAAQAKLTRAQPDQDVQDAKAAQSAPAKFAAPHSVVQKRQNRPVVVRNSPTKMLTRNPKKLPRQLQNARAQAVPAPGARAQGLDENPPPKPDIKWLTR
jgi:hypothetical protein